MSSTLHAAVAATVLTALAGLAAPPAGAQTISMPRVDLDYDKETDFSTFRSYSWKDPGAGAKTQEMHTRIIWYVERELEKKGLKKAAEGQGDLFVRYFAKSEESVQGTASQGESRLPGGSGSLSTSVDFHKVTAGTLILELQRGKDQKTVWRAGSQYRSIDRNRIDAETAKAVRQLLGKYPPPKP
jgi:hypothetical protein